MVTNWHNLYLSTSPRTTIIINHSQYKQCQFKTTAGNIKNSMEQYVNEVIDKYQEVVHSAVAYQTGSWFRYLGVYRIESQLEEKEADYKNYNKQSMDISSVLSSELLSLSITTKTTMEMNQQIQ